MILTLPRSKQPRRAVISTLVIALILGITGCASRSSTPGSGGGLPSAPANVAAVAVNSQINVSWNSSTASLGVAAYLVERCQGKGCTTFTQVASIGGTSNTYTDTGLAPNAVYSYRLRAQDSSGSLSSYSNTATATTNTTGAPPSITSSNAAAGIVGTAFSYQITAANSPTSFAASGLPAGLTVNTTSGLISGTPTASGSFPVSLSATNSTGTGTAALTLTVANAAPVITSSTAANGTVGTVFSYQITASNSPTSFAASGLPAGLSVNTSTGLISGTLPAAGTSKITLSATNGGGTGTSSLTLTVTTTASSPAITSSGTATGTVGTAFSYQITASNSPTSFGASGLPAGITVNATNGLISGAPTVAGTFPVGLSATNSTGTGTAALTLTVANVAPVITSSAAASAIVGTAFSYQITATNSPTSFNASGLPAGLTVNTATGLISGTPTAGGTSSVTVSATNSTGTGNATLTLTLTVASPVVTSATTASGNVGTAFSYQITATNSPTSFNASGLPAGLTVNTTTGLISGTPTAAGTSNVTVSATNSTGTGNATLTLTVTVAAPVITSGSTASATVGTAFSYQVTATNSPTSFNATGLPAGLTVNTTTGLISGTPTTAGTSTVSISATNKTGTGTANLTLTVSVPAPVITSAGTASGTVGTVFSYQITATNSPTSFGASGLPAGLAVNTTTGLISGTPTTAGTSTVTLTATNSAGSGSTSVTLTIAGGGTGPVGSHSIRITNDSDDGYYDSVTGTGWHSATAVDRIGSWAGITAGWVTGYRFPATGANSGDTIQSAYLELINSNTLATSSICGAAPCSNSYAFRVYGVAQDDGQPFSNAAGNTPLDVPYTSSYVDYTATGPGDAHGSCQGKNNGQNTCTHTINVTNIVREITSRPGWTSTSAMRFVLLSTDSKAPNVYVGYADSSNNANRAVTLNINPPLPTIVSSGAWGTNAMVTYPTTYNVGPYVYSGASTLLLFLGDYYNFYGQQIPQPTISDSCGNRWYVLAGPTNWAGFYYFMRSTVYYVQNPASCPAGSTITISTTIQEPIFLHFVAVAGSDTANAPIASAISSPSPGVYTTSATSNSIALTKPGLLLSWIFGDSDAMHVFTPQSGFTTDLNSTPNYLTTVFSNVPSPGSYQSQFSISPSDGWQVVIVGLHAP